jgi:hypothetical protein
LAGSELALSTLANADRFRPKNRTHNTLIGFSSSCTGFSKFSVVIFHPKISTFFNDLPDKRQKRAECIGYKEIVGALLPPVSPLSPVSIIIVIVLVIPIISTLFPSPLNGLQVIFDLPTYLSHPFRYKYLSAAIVGAFSVKQLEENLGAVDVKLSPEENKCCDDMWLELRPPRFFYGR